MSKIINVECVRRIIMKCPYCNQEMQKGIISGDGRSKVYWKAGDKKVNFMDKLESKGKIEAVKYTLASFAIEANYCITCKKMIFETDISK